MHHLWGNARRWLYTIQPYIGLPLLIIVLSYTIFELFDVE